MRRSLVVAAASGAGSGPGRLPSLFSFGGSDAAPPLPSPGSPDGSEPTTTTTTTTVATPLVAVTPDASAPPSPSPLAPLPSSVASVPGARRLRPIMGGPAPRLLFLGGDEVSLASLAALHRRTAAAGGTRFPPVSSPAGLGVPSTTAPGLRQLEVLCPPPPAGASRGARLGPVLKYALDEGLRVACVPHPASLSKAWAPPVDVAAWAPLGRVRYAGVPVDGSPAALGAGAVSALPPGGSGGSAATTTVPLVGGAAAVEAAAANNANGAAALLRFVLPHCLPDPAHRSDPFDIAIVVSFRYFLPPSVLALLPRFVINMHPSLLPRYRGASPIHATLARGEARGGVSVIKIAPHEPMDCGDILLQRSVPLPLNTDVRTYFPAAAALGAECLLEVLFNKTDGSGSNSANGGKSAGTPTSLAADPDAEHRAPAGKRGVWGADGTALPLRSRLQRLAPGLARAIESRAAARAAAQRAEERAAADAYGDWGSSPHADDDDDNATTVAAATPLGHASLERVRSLWDNASVQLGKPLLGAPAGTDAFHAPRLKKDAGRVDWERTSALGLWHQWRAYVGTYPLYCLFDRMATPAGAQVKSARRQLPARAVVTEAACPTDVGADVWEELDEVETAAVAAEEAAAEASSGGDDRAADDDSDAPPVARRIAPGTVFFPVADRSIGAIRCGVDIPAAEAASFAEKEPLQQTRWFFFRCVRVADGPSVGAAELSDGMAMRPGVMYAGVFRTAPPPELPTSAAAASSKA